MPKRGVAVVLFAVFSVGCGEEQALVSWPDTADFPTPIADDEPPSLPSLTVPGLPDASGALALASLHIDVKVFGRLARTEVTQVFNNHLPRQTEGIYEMTLPEDAVISRLAMDVDGTMVEGELVVVVEEALRHVRQRARTATDARAVLDGAARAAFDDRLPEELGPDDDAVDAGSAEHLLEHNDVVDDAAELVPLPFAVRDEAERRPERGRALVPRQHADPNLVEATAQRRLDGRIDRAPAVT